MIDRRAISIDDLLDIALVGDAQVSPDGRRVAFVRKSINKDKDEYALNIWMAEGGQVRQFTSGGKDSSPQWSPDGRYLAFISAREDKPSIYVIATDGGEATRLTPSEARTTSFAWSPDSSSLAYTASVRTDEHGVEREIDDAKPDSEKDKKKAETKVTERLGMKADGVGFVHDRRTHIFVISRETQKIEQLTKGDYSAASPSWSPDGKHIAFAANRNARWDVEIESQIWQVPAGGGEPTCMSGARGSWGRPVYSPSGRHLAFVGSPLREDQPFTAFASIWRVNRRGQQLTDLLEGLDLDIDDSVITDLKIEGSQSPRWDDNGIWFLVSEAGSSNICRWDKGIHRETEGLHDIRDFTVQGDALAYTCASPADPGDIYLRKAGKTDRLTTVNQAFFDGVEVCEPDPIQFQGSGGDTVHGWLIKPRNAESASALVVYIHGGPQAAYGNSFFHEMQVLAAQGYGVLLINPHGSSSHGEAYESAIHGAWGERDFEDVMAATDLVSRLDWVDDKRIAIAGGSYGGYMASWAIGHTDRYAAAVIERSLVNMLSFVGTTDIPNWWPYAWKATIEKNPMRLWEMSPLAYVGKMKTPSLVIHSENDHRCPVEQGEQIFTGLRRNGVSTRFVRFPEESHGLSRGGKPSRRIERLNEILTWFKRFL